ncbi:MAG TPA: CocE/NonD family hydrolase [Candidatus Lustribacter sp.]|nr:CocE/NonD family hydrolase [Candidatus Lustribacter sp.]
MRDGVELSVNAYRPPGEGRVPVVMSVTPYGKDALPDRIGMLFMRLAGVRFGTLDCSPWTGFEAPDPAFWTQAGYAVVQADVRGMHKSDGHAGVLTDKDAEDYYDLIEWAASRPWCNGAVGLIGVSYLCMSQWRVAPLRPPGLKAIVPWEGVSDLLREFGYQEGIPETGFISVWWRNRMQRGHNQRFPLAEDFPAERDARPLDDPWWAEKRPALERIVVPALVCASWSDQGLHTRGSFEGFERIASSEKWLFTHGRRKWEAFYTPESRAVQLRFFDRYLKGEQNGWEATPRVRLEVRKSRTDYDVRYEAAWPLASVSYTPLHLDATSGSTAPALPADPASLRYDACKGRASFTHRFERDTELTGAMSLKLWVSTSDGDDLDLFVAVRKFDRNGREVPFYGYNGYAEDCVCKGWLRVSHRELDPVRSRPGRPWHTHATYQPVNPNDVVDVEIELLSSSTLFEAGSSLRIDILGHDAARYPAFRHGRTVNRGFHSIHTGGRYDSHLLAAVVAR